LAAARNFAANKANCDILAITDADIAVNPQWLEYPCYLLKHHNEFGAVQCNIVLSEDINKIASFLLESSTSYSTNVSKKKPDTIYESLFPVGAAFVIRKEVYNKVGGFDSWFFIANDDVDFGIRLWLYGYKVIVSRQGTVYHKFGTLRYQNQISPIFKFYALRNMLLIWTKNLEGKTIFKHVLPFSALYPIMAFRYGRVIGVKGILSFFKNLSYAITKRHEVQCLRKTSDDRIFKMLHQHGALPIDLLINDIRLIYHHLFPNKDSKSKGC
jgi:GT2 family glycosyltransferase